MGKLSEAALVFDGREPLPLHRNEDGVWQGRVVLISQGGYHVKLKDSMGFSNPDPVHYRVEMTQDLPPQVEIVSPARDLELNEGDELPITYVAKDDFSISSLHMKYSTGGGELKSIRIAGGTDPLISGQYMWQLVGPEFSHGNLITYYLEVLDNDTISGPHTGVSRTYTLKIKGREEEHRRIEENIASILEDLLWLLGDQLEEQDRISRALASTHGGERNGDIIRGAQTKRDFQKRLGDIVQEVDDVMAEMAMDPLASYLAYFNLQALRKNLDYLARTTVAKSIRALERAASGEGGAAEESRHLEERMTEGLEQAVLLAEDAGKESRAADLADLSSDMLREQGDLMDMLRRLTETGDMGAVEELDQQLARLQDMLSKFMEKLSEFARTPPEEFLNSESLRSLDMGQLQELLREMQDAFQRGDMEKAMELAEKFMDSLSKLMAMLQEMSSMAMGRFQQFQETTNSVVDELKRIIEGQKSVLAGTESVHHDMTEHLRKLQLEKGSELSRSVRDQLSRMVKALDGRIREGFKRGEIDRKDYSGYGSLKRRVNDIIGRLNKGDPSGFLEAFQGLSAELRAMAERLSARSSSSVQGNRATEGDFQKHLRNLNGLARELGSLSPGPQHLTEDEGLRLKELSADQNGLRKDTGRLAAFLKGLSQLLPTLLPEIADNLSGAESEMDRSAGRLYQEDSGSALPSQREALFLLKKAMDQLEEAVGQLSAAASLKGMPMPMLMGQQAPFPMPFGFMPNIGYSEGGRLGHTLKPFKIPTGEDYEVPRLLREEVLEALKEGYPGKYKEEVGEYFRNLSK
jgi:hypothetical protein